ncbi:MAG: 23S rRNA (uracil(1939)-C(5))-methyltransferase RlmD [Cytophagales bacterium]|nr:MAG: 23S rRNA (uracil(1939)-C(5))-methyltransferase RlmD [Cytophagales bacterium]TAF62287.1 MAG: 23S rRNA (uracil(1939)-C(5))-methyltransferase RlmD [Cytophagales bacterium]
MKKKRIQPEELEQLTIQEATSEGFCMAKTADGKVVFVRHAAPQDVVDIRITKQHRRFAEGEIVKFHQKSPLRVAPVCSHYGVCGGCKWQHLSYEHQLAFKEKQVIDNLARIGKVELPQLTPILGSENQYFYRNKLEFTFSTQRWLTDEEVKTTESFDEQGRLALGFHIPQRFDRVLDIQSCHLQSDFSNRILNAVRDFAKAEKLSFYDLRTHTGLLRTLTIRQSVRQEHMVIVQFGAKEDDTIELLMQHLAKNFPEIASLNYLINTKKNDTYQDQDIVCYKGQPYITEYMENLQFRVSPKSFFQTNSGQAYRLYKLVRDMAQLNSTDRVYDLYTGTGTIALFLAAQIQRIVGVEYVADAIADAQKNAELNHIKNAFFEVGDMAKTFNDAFVERHGMADLVITDPPRSGMHPDVVSMLTRLLPARIVYVSCNPATQARDLALMDAYYRVAAVQPVDMFPHTPHVENIVRLERR